MRVRWCTSFTTNHPLWNELILGVHAHNPLPLVARVHTSLAILLIMMPETLSQVRINPARSALSPRDHSMFRCSNTGFSPIPDARIQIGIQKIGHQVGAAANNYH